MSGDAEVTSPGSTARLEAFFKLATGVFAVFYVVGLLISNIQLMEVGISDFASLQARNVLIGFVFALYILGVFIVAVPLVFLVAFVLLAINLRQKVGLIALAAVFAIPFFALSAMIWLGVVGGFFLPWGAPYDFWYPDHPHSFSMIPVLLEKAYSQFGDLYLFKKLLPVVAGLGFVAFWVLKPIVQSTTAKKGMSDEKLRGEVRSEILAAGLPVALLSLPLLIFGYANDVYPNLKYNLGGGQPDVVELVLSGRKAELAGINADSLCCVGENVYEAKKLGPVVIWHQSDKYFYISSPSHIGQKTQTELTAVDLKLVRSVRYLPDHVKVSAGAQLISVHSH